MEQEPDGERSGALTHGMLLKCLQIDQQKAEKSLFFRVELIPGNQFFFGAKVGSFYPFEKKERDPFVHRAEPPPPKGRATATVVNKGSKLFFKKLFKQKALVFAVLSKQSRRKGAETRSFLVGQGKRIFLGASESQRLNSLEGRQMRTMVFFSENRERRIDTKTAMAGNGESIKEILSWIEKADTTGEVLNAAAYATGYTQALLDLGKVNAKVAIAFQGRIQKARVDRCLLLRREKGASFKSEFSRGSVQA